MAAPAASLTTQRFQRDGFVVVRGLASAEECSALRQATLSALAPVEGPVEYEADVGYPGAPPNSQAEGGDTVRRLLSAYSRGEVYKRWLTDHRLRDHLSDYMNSKSVCLSQNHHNCIMTKHPGFSSSTAWHQDIRYWSFDRPELVSAWLALGEENQDNGVLSFIPGSHQMDFDRGRFDQHLFLRPELEQNAELMQAAVSVDLAPGDVVFFHCRTFHSAGRNLTDRVKLSLVSTYHDLLNHPIPGTRSAMLPSIPL